MTKKPILVLHVGTGKTGTSFIQETLAQNAEAMMGQGVLYPRSARGVGAAGHHQLLASLTQDHKWWMGKQREGGELLNDLCAEITEATPEVAIVSQEGLVWLPVEVVHQLGVLLLAQFDVRIVIDLRRHDLFVDSALSQVVKAAGHHYEFGKYWRFDGSWFVPNYRAQIEKWARTFGPRSIVIRPYEKSQFLGEHLVDDFFLRVIGRKVPVTPATGDHAANDRVSRRSVEFLRLMNGLFVKKPTRVPGFIQPLAEFDRKMGWTDYSVLGDQVRQTIIASSRPQLNALVGRFNRPLPNGRPALHPGMFVEPFRPTGLTTFQGLDVGDVRCILDELRTVVPKLVQELAQHPLPDELDAYDRHQVEMIKSLI